MSAEKGVGGGGRVVNPSRGAAPRALLRCPCSEPLGLGLDCGAAGEDGMNTGCGVIGMGACCVLLRGRRADWGVRVISRVSRQPEIMSQTLAMSEVGAMSHGTTFWMCLGSMRARVRKVPADATSFSNCLGGRMTSQGMYGLLPMRKCRSFCHVTSSSRSAALFSLDTVCFPLSGSKSADSCEATVAESEMTDKGDEGREVGGGSEWINSAAYLRIRQS